MNLCIDRKRRGEVRPLDEAADVADEADDALAKFGQSQVSREVKAAIAALPERQRAALILCFYEGVSNVEAAEIMSLTVGAVESLLVRARRGLKEALAHVYADL